MSEHQKDATPKRAAQDRLPLITPERVTEAEKTTAVLSAQRAARRLERHLGRDAAAEVLRTMSLGLAAEHIGIERVSGRREYDPTRDPIPPCPHPGGIVDATGFDAFDFALSVVLRLGRPKVNGQTWRSPLLAIGGGKSKRWLELEQDGRYREVSLGWVEVMVRRELEKHTLFAERDNVRGADGRHWHGLPCGQHIGVTIALVRKVVTEIALLPCVGFESVGDALGCAGGTK